MDRDLELELLLADRGQKPTGPSPGKAQASQSLVAHAQDGDVRRKYAEHQQQAREGRADARHQCERDRRYPQRHGAAQLDHARVQRDLDGHYGRQAEQRREVEHVRADHHTGADVLVVVNERGDGGRDLGCVGRERREQAEQRLGQTQARSDALQRRDEQPARREADRCGKHEGDAEQRIRHVKSPGSGCRDDARSLDLPPRGHADQASRLAARQSSCVACEAVWNARGTRTPEGLHRYGPGRGEDLSHASGGRRRGRQRARCGDRLPGAPRPSRDAGAGRGP